MSAVSRWHTGPVLGLMLSLACASPPGDDEAAPSVRTRSSTQPLTSLGAAVTLDINRSNESSAPDELLVVGERVFFSADDGVTGRELYVSDGTSGGTVRVKDLFPGRVSSNPTGLAVLGEHVYFFATTNDQPNTAFGYVGLWKTDGTEAGTTKVLEFRNIPFAPRLVRSGSLLFFNGYDSETGNELWKTDGTTQGTVRVKDLRPGLASSHPFGLVDVGGVLFFIFYAGEGTAYDLWRSDGTEAGTVRVSDLEDTTVQVVGASLLLTRTVRHPNGTFRELWRSDGTAAGLTPIKQLWPEDNSDVAWPTVVGNRLYFFRGNGDFWTSDGTEAGTVLLKHFNGRLPASNPHAATGSQLYFVADDGTTGMELWTSNGTAAGTRLFADLMPGAEGSAPSSLVVVNGVLYFSAREPTRGRELWRTTGLAPVPFHDIAPGAFDSVPERTVATADGQTLFFRATDGVHGQELWKTDGTPEGTTLTRDIASRPAGSGVTGFTVLGTRGFFTADDGLSGREPWVTDGTAEGTRMLADLVPGARGANPHRFTVYKDALFFVVDNAEGTQELWKTDGSTQGTVRLDGVGRAYSLHGLMEVGGSLLFMEDYSGFWKTDGTPGGTVLYAQTDEPGRTAANDSSYEPPAKVGDALYSLAASKAHGSEVWRLDGTAHGTHLLKDLLPGSSSNDIRNLTGAGHTLFFTVTDYSNGSSSLWKSDGTEAGTTRVSVVTDIHLQISGKPLVALGDSVIYVDFPAGGPFSLWKSDGTSEGTVKLHAPPEGSYSINYGSLTGVGSQVFFVANSGQGRELWRTDGTSEGTRLVKDIQPRLPSGEEVGYEPTALTALGGLLYFAVSDGVSGEELWRSDGTDEGTVRVADLVPGAGGSSPRVVASFGDGLLVAASDEAVGFEPRVLVPSSVTCPIPPRQEATSGAGASYSYPPALLADGVPASTSIHYSHPSGSVFPLGSTTVQATAEAPGFRVRSCAFVVTVSDTTPPSLKCPSTKVVEATDEEGAAVEYPPASVSDAVSSAEVTYSHPSGGRFPRGNTKVEVTATDAAHNTATCSFGVNVYAPGTGPSTAPPEESSGCGCDTASPALAWWVLFLLVPAVRRRVRAPARN